MEDFKDFKNSLRVKMKDFRDLKDSLRVRMKGFKGLENSLRVKIKGSHLCFSCPLLFWYAPKSLKIYSSSLRVKKSIGMYYEMISESSRKESIIKSGAAFSSS